jgi:hypothetical protein
MLIYDQRNFDLHLTQLNCAIANWATIIHIICCSSAQVNASLGLKFVECAILGKTVKRKADAEDFVWMQINGHSVGD